ncbi:exodeoxyribonuclease VII large subunit [Anaerococcus prevotii]|uniref:Exodeoxyribonuclease 7 large subunit n=1 Tax=Anaerococcus prevotii ACS-065-V-Col13 TaxID=879305 RepID=F0GUK8_9FIRM|nr:exodeoxyribonuclease VII large subunit [Anaerococcus prevotii]EGC82501.1 exodeoxyribonuclease VII, large subunit [Anaerococcus prevotii ACS-065-V-Col13]
MRKPLSVKQFNEYFKSNIKHDPIFQNLYINGQLSNIRVNNSHLYFSLKEDNEIIDCVIYYFEDKDINFDFEEGIDVNVKGNVFYNNYSSRIIISAKEVSEVGISENYKKFLDMKEEFRKLGYFDEINKKAIPKYPKKVGLITSKDGAAVIDFISVINQKANDINIFLYPVKVQGLESSNLIKQAICDLDHKNLDVIVITRGGGSNEDLSTFNNRDIVEAVFDAKTPIISAIGHKIDLTLLDLVSDLSLQTPTEAGSYIIASYANLEKDLDDVIHKMKQIIGAEIDSFERNLLFLERDLRSFHPLNNLNNIELELSFIKKELDTKLKNSLSINENRLKLIKSNLDHQNDVINIKKSMIFVKAKDKNIYSAKSLDVGDKIILGFSDGDVKAEIIDG